MTRLRQEEERAIQLLKGHIPSTHTSLSDPQNRVVADAHRLASDLLHGEVSRRTVDLAEGGPKDPSIPTTTLGSTEEDIVDIED